MLPGPPAATRAFAQNDQLALFTDIYDNDTSNAHKVDITATLTADEGRVVFKNAEERSTADLAREEAAASGTARRSRCRTIRPASTS